MLLWFVWFVFVDLMKRTIIEKAGRMRVFWRAREKTQRSTSIRFLKVSGAFWESSMLFELSSEESSGIDDWLLDWMRWYVKICHCGSSLDNSSFAAIVVNFMLFALTRTHEEWVKAHIVRKDGWGDSTIVWEDIEGYPALVWCERKKHFTESIKSSKFCVAHCRGRVLLIVDTTWAIIWAFFARKRDNFLHHFLLPLCLYPPMYTDLCVMAPSVYLYAHIFPHHAH